MAPRASTVAMAARASRGIASLCIAADPRIAAAVARTQTSARTEPASTTAVSAGRHVGRAPAMPAPAFRSRAAEGCAVDAALRRPAMGAAKATCACRAIETRHAVTTASHATTARSCAVSRAWLACAGREHGPHGGQHAAMGRGAALHPAPHRAHEGRGRLGIRDQVARGRVGESGEVPKLVPSAFR
jgi:hypothetical protein